MLRRLVDGGVDGIYLPLSVLVQQGKNILVDGMTPPPPPTAIPADPFDKSKSSSSSKPAASGRGARLR